MTVGDSLSSLSLNFLSYKMGVKICICWMTGGDDMYKTSRRVPGIQDSTQKQQNVLSWLPLLLDTGVGLHPLY